MNKHHPSSEDYKKALTALLDESERIFFSYLDEGDYYPHLFRKINESREILGMNPFKLCAKDKELEKSSGVLVEIKKLDHFDESFELPSYETNGSAGCDLKASLHNEDRKSGLRLIPNECITIPTGLCMAIPKGYEIQVRPRSGMSLKTKLRIPNSPGTIDSDYRGEIKVILENIGGESIVIEHGDRIAQLVLVKVPQAQFREVSEELSKTDRGEGGFGSTGVK